MNAALRILRSREAVLFLVLVGLFAVMSWRVEYFLDLQNLFDQARYWVAPGLIAIAMTFIIATGGIDLSVGSILALSGIVVGLLYRDAGWPIWAAAGCAVLVAGAAGALNGAVVAYVRVPALVVTLATMTLFRGLAMGLLGKQRPVGDFPASFRWLGQGDAFPVPGSGAAPAYVPVSVIVLIVAFALGWALMRRSWVGRFTELLGENQIAAAFAGINVPALKFGLFTGCGFLCGLAGMFHTAQVNTALADTAQDMALDVVACVVIGGTRISGGHASMIGSLLGLLIIGILRFGLDLAGVPSQNTIIVIGLVLIVTAVFNEWMASRTSGEKQ